MSANGNAVSASAKSRFDRALVELQVGLKVIPIGVAQAGAWNYAFIYEILQRHFPDLPEQARPIGRGEARRVLVQRYLDNIVAADRAMIAKVFHVLKWTPKELDRTIAGTLPGYPSQIDPIPRVAANEQLEALAKHNLVRLAWQPGQTDHLLNEVTLEQSVLKRLYALIRREPLAR
jgi:hypothetical protein